MVQELGTTSELSQVLSEEVTELTQRIPELKAELEGYELRSDEARRTSQRLDDIQSQVEEAERVSKEWNAYLEALESRKSQLVLKCQAIEEDLNRSLSEQSRIQCEQDIAVREYQSQVEQYSCKLIELNAEIQASSKSIADLASEREMLQQELLLLKQDIDAKCQLIGQLEQTIAGKQSRELADKEDERVGQNAPQPPEKQAEIELNRIESFVGSLQVDLGSSIEMETKSRSGEEASSSIVDQAAENDKPIAVDADDISSPPADPWGDVLR